MSEESKEKMRISRAKHSGPWKGKTFSMEYRKKLSDAHKGQVAWNKGTKGVVKAWNKGLSNTWCKGEKNVNWKGGITPINQALRESMEYEEWRTAVYVRDNYTCQSCGQVGGRLQADHIKLWSVYPELRFDIDNGQTLCFDCHRAKTVEDLKVHWINQSGRGFKQL